MGRHRTDEPSDDEPTGTIDHRAADPFGSAHEATAPDDTAPNDTAPDDTAPDDTAPDDTAPDDTAPNDTESAETANEPDVGRRNPEGRRWPPKRILSVAMFAAGVLVLIAALWTGWRTYQAYSHLADARTTVATMDSTVQAKGLDGLDDLGGLVDTFAGQTTAARSAVDDPLVRLASHIPFIGENLTAVRDVATGMDGIAQSIKSGLPALTPLANHSTWASNGRFDLAVLKPAANALSHLDNAVQSAIGSARSLDRGLVVSPVNNALNEYGAQLEKLSDMTSVGAQAANIVMPILGADGPRTYLIAFQNLAELRTSGGLLAFYAELRVDNGHLSIGASGSSDRDFKLSSPIPGVDPALSVLYGGDIARFPQDVNITPDFPTSASAFAQMYQRHSGTSVDGVIAIDPVVVATLMKGRPPIDIGHGLTLSSETAVDTLLSRMYDVFPGGNQLAERDALMSDAIHAAFQSVVDGIAHVNLTDALSDIRTLIDQRRILAWSAHSGDETQILATPISGRQRTDAAGAPQVGVFLNSRTGAKLDYYARATASLGSATCAPNGTATVPLSVTLTNNAPVTGLPPYVLGAMYGKPVPDTYLNLVITAPSGGGTIGTPYVDGQAAPAHRSRINGRDVAVFSVTLVPKKPVSITVEMSVSTTGQGTATVTPGLVTTPMAYPFPTSTKTFTACR